MVFNWNLTRKLAETIYRQVVDLDLLLCTGHSTTGVDLEDGDLFLCLLCTQRPMNDRKIEESDKCCFGL